MTRGTPPWDLLGSPRGCSFVGRSMSYASPLGHAVSLTFPMSICFEGEVRHRSAVFTGTNDRSSAPSESLGDPLTRLNGGQPDACLEVPL